MPYSSKQSYYEQYYKYTYFNFQYVSVNIYSLIQIKKGYNIIINSLLFYYS